MAFVKGLRHSRTLKENRMIIGSVGLVKWKDDSRPFATKSPDSTHDTNSFSKKQLGLSINSTDSLLTKVETDLETIEQKIDAFLGGVEEMSRAIDGKPK